MLTLWYSLDRLNHFSKTVFVFIFQTHTHTSLSRFYYIAGHTHTHGHVRTHGINDDNNSDNNNNNDDDSGRVVTTIHTQTHTHTQRENTISQTPTSVAGGTEKRIKQKKAQTREKTKTTKNNCMWSMRSTRRWVFTGDVYDGKENDWMWPCFVVVCVNWCVVCCVYCRKVFLFPDLCNFGLYALTLAVCKCVNGWVSIWCSRLFVHTLETQRLLHHFHWEWAHALQTV